MRSKTKHSPAGKKIEDLEERIARLEAFERWRVPIKVDFEALLGKAVCGQYWELCDRIVNELQLAQVEATSMRSQVERLLERSLDATALR